MGNLAVWYAHVDARTMQQVLAVQLAEAEHKLLVKTLAKAQKRDYLQALGKLTRVIDGERRFMQAKEAQPSVLEAFVDKRAREPRAARRHRSTAHAGDQRHLPRLGAGRCRRAAA
jgi:hypothetical protein